MAMSNNPDWWRGAVIYQIYPRSFQDSNGDGVGDLRGITARLPYVASLGVDAVWISPFFCSPMKDFGYDITDHCDIEPGFGTLDDCKAMINAAHDLGLRLIFDIVISHTSDKHPWFQESRKSRTNPMADWYVWADPKQDGTPPNNWLSIFGGSAWQWDTTREQYYLHNFLTSQPDLNFHNPAVQDAVLKIIKFWLDMGTDGFRFDTVNFFFHDKELRNNPALLLGDRRDFISPKVNPYNYQNHIYDRNRPENLDFLKRVRQLTDSYPNITTLGEIGDDQRSMEILGDYTSGNERLHMSYAFELLSPRPLTGTHVARTLDLFHKHASKGWICWAFSNHDVMRSISRWNLSREAAMATGALLLSLRGSVCIYQGEELGLKEADIPFEQLQDPYGITFWPEFKGRDGCRTPMVWEKSSPSAGFSTTNSSTWLPIPRDHLALAVDVQHRNDDSLLNFYRRFILFRKNWDALVRGDWNMIEASETFLSFLRTTDTQELFCAFNFGQKGCSFTLPHRQGGRWELIPFTPFHGSLSGAEALLPPLQAFFAVHVDDRKKH